MYNEREAGDDMEKLKIAIGADHGGFKLKEKIVQYLKEKNIEFEDFGTFSEDSCDYPDYGKKVAKEVSEGKFNRGILVCGSGIGMSIVANKFKGVIAALCWNKATATSARTHNNSNVLCLGERQLDDKLALEIVYIWLNKEFEGGRHKVRVDKIED